MATAQDTQGLLDQTEAARRLGVAPRTLERWRWSGDGPPYISVSRRAARYDPRDLDQWISARRRTSTSDPGNGAA